MVKTGLALFLALWTPVQAAEPAFDALNHLLREYAGPVDEKAAEAAPETDAPKGERLAKVSADLALLAAGLETFRAATPAALPDDFVPELKPFFKDRDTALATVYRTLAVTDYTWALRFEGGDCEPRERRAALLADSDGLFASGSGELSPWLLRLLGPAAKGKSSSEALDRASRRAALSARDYELLRAKAAKIEAALLSEKAVGADRAKLYCRRADIYESLAGAHRVDASPIAASRATDDRSGDSVFLMVWSSSSASSRAVGAGVMIETPSGPKVFTDARLRSDGPGTLSAVVRGKDGRLGARYPFKPESVDNPTGVMVGLVPGADVPSLKLATGPAALSDLVRAIGHIGAAGAWSVSQGLVTDAKTSTFASDAILGPDMLGGPLLNEAGEVVGLIVLSPAGKPVAIRPERLLQISQTSAVLGDVEFASARQSGSASVLTTAMPIVGELRGAGGEAVEAGLPSSLGGVNWEGGGGVGNWRPHSSAGPPSGYSSYSSGSSSSYSNSDTGGAELGRALGQALAPLVEALIFKGIPALFRGIGSLFKSKPKAAPVAKVVIPKKVEPKLKPKAELKVRLSSQQDKDGLYAFTATVTSTDPEQLSVGGLAVNFTVNGITKSAKTNPDGVAMIYVDNPPPSVAAHKGLDEESAKHPRLIETGNRTFAENACLAALGATALTLEVSVVVAASAGGPAGPAAAAVCVKVNPLIVVGALATCALIKGAEMAADKPAINNSVRQTPAIAQTDKTKVTEASEKHLSGLDAEAAKIAGTEDVSTPGDPNEPPDQDKWRKESKNRREEMLARAEDAELKDSIKQLYREKAEIGDGSSMDALRYERATGQRLSRFGHAEKLVGRRTQLLRILRKPGFSASDAELTKEMLINIQDALSGM